MLNIKSIFQPFLNRKFIIGYVASLVLLYLINRILNRTVSIFTFNVNFNAIVQIVILCASVYLIRFRKFEGYILGILTSMASLIIAFYFKGLIHSYSNIVEWDFLCFYLNGKATVDGLSLYDPSSFMNVLSNINLPYKLSDDFYTEAILPGVIYPPTTMLLLAPIGYLDLNTANIVWRIFVISFMVIDIVLLYNIFKIHESKWIQLTVIVVITLIFPGSRFTLDCSQTNFFVLFLILLIYKDPDNWKAGIYLAIAIIVKPIPIIWVLYYLVNRKWKPLFSFTIAGMVIVLLSIIQLGFKNFITYFTSPPVLRIPAAVFSEDVNQSINAVFSRISLQLGLESIVEHMNIIVLIVTLLLVIISCIASYKLYKSNAKASFLIFIPLSLLIFPGTLTYYAVQLIPLFFAMILIKDKTSLIYFSTFLIVLYFSLFAASLIILTVMIIYAIFDIPIFTKIEINGYGSIKKKVT